MLQQLRPGIQLCLDRAGECERLAELATEPRSKEIYRHIANQWRSLAAHPEFVEQIDSLCICSGKGQVGEGDPSPGSPAT